MARTINLPRRDAVINLRVTPDELAEYDRTAAQRGMVRSEWMRQCMRADVARALAEQASRLRKSA